ncbi:nucleotidyl transferase AbiEii/AbiGii toxin family protein [Aliidiomarina haloalkalitolerans]|uniref:Nucleotidyl transferase AbiEii/AbiGii toxin family protein n=1 Tax=Aliidiomarina haloalkalitolerans TaxID=859059 RepID=A0A432VQW2_9GAMM|nr:nucleotidyl transferase AbiEii/AbiGii toxin family protein [Aliidiomarina haloalkalitolerans]RUO18648.1 hypothetical protein CWE06_10415 [Aliidiomarina haloalkalitolerans]
MDRSSIYYQQVQLLIEVLPFISRYDCFALKGGTAINLFVRDLPRLSVDIDLVFLPDLERRAALQMIMSSLEMIASRLMSDLTNIIVVKSFKTNTDALRLIVERTSANRTIQVKIELSPVLRGTVYPPRMLQVTEAVESEFGFAETSVVDLPDLYAGKICAALDRQHPRDLFDVKLLLQQEGLTTEIRKALIIYLISHQRPIAELLKPTFKDISAIYDSEFKSMTEINVSLTELYDTRIQLLELIHAELTDDERKFLITFKSRDPNWSLLGLAQIEQIKKLPAVRWKLHNLNLMNADKHQTALEKLASALLTTSKS